MLFKDNVYHRVGCSCSSCLIQDMQSSWELGEREKNKQKYRKRISKENDVDIEMSAMCFWHFPILCFQYHIGAGRMNTSSLCWYFYLIIEVKKKSSPEMNRHTIGSKLISFFFSFHCFAFLYSSVLISSYSLFFWPSRSYFNFFTWSTRFALSSCVVVSCHSTPFGAFLFSRYFIYYYLRLWLSSYFFFSFFLSSFYSFLSKLVKHWSTFSSFRRR